MNETNKEFQVEVEALVQVAVFVEADSEEQARDIAGQWRPDPSGCHRVTHYFADHSTDNGDSVELQEPVALEWEILDTTIEKTMVEKE